MMCTWSKIMRTVTAIAILILLCVSGRVTGLPKSGPGEASISLPAELQRVLTDYETAWRNKDAAGLSQLFTEDGFVLSPGEEMVRGRAAIMKIYAGWGGPLFLRAVAFATNGDVGYIVGGFSHQQGAADDGKFTLTLRKEALGRWLIFSDMDSSNHKSR
jgi:ketosteroid isomerase-like protein